MSANGEGLGARLIEYLENAQEADDERAAIQDAEREYERGNHKANGHALNGDAVERQAEQQQPGDPFSWLKDHEMTNAEVDKIADPTWIEPGFIVESHVVAVVAKPNGGKTTIVFHLACRWTQLGYQVVYVHADTNPADAKRMREIAQQ